MHRSLAFAKNLRKITTHSLNRIPISVHHPIDWTILGFLAAIRALSQPCLCAGQPAQFTIVKLHVILFVLNRNDADAGKLAVEVMVGVAFRFGSGIGGGVTFNLITDSIVSCINPVVDTLSGILVARAAGATSFRGGLLGPSFTSGNFSPTGPYRAMTLREFKASLRSRGLWLTGVPLIRESSRELSNLSIRANSRNKLSQQFRRVCVLRINRRDRKTALILDIFRAE